jgi:hypothetical protein
MSAFDLYRRFNISIPELTRTDTLFQAANFNPLRLTINSAGCMSDVLVWNEEI